MRSEPCTAAIGAYWAKPHLASEEECAALQDLADTTAVALQNVQLYEELEQRVASRTRELTEANRDLEAFAYTVAHDLRSPLGSIVVLADSLQRAYAREKSEAEHSRELARIRQITETGQRLGDLVGSMLELSRASRSELRKEQLNFSALAAAVVAELRQREPERSVRFQIEPGLTAFADRVALEVVLHNLLGNSLKYTRPRATAEIHVGRVSGDAAARGPSPEGSPVFFVRDNGVGFALGSESRLFTPFHRLDNAGGFEGTGIGLSTVARIVQRHGGAVWAEAAPDAGATLYFSLPQSLA